MITKRKDRKTAPADEALQLVTFQVGAEEYGLDISAISEVVRPLRITPLPRMPRFIEGVVNLRGVIIPVVDLRVRFELKTIRNDPRKMRMVIARRGAPGASELLGLVVDGVDEVLDVPKKNIDRAPDAARGANAEFIAGMCKVADRLVILLDIASILSREERAALAEAEHA